MWKEKKTKKTCEEINKPKSEKKKTASAYHEPASEKNRKTAGPIAMRKISSFMWEKLPIRMKQEIALTKFLEPK